MIWLVLSLVAILLALGSAKLKALKNEQHRRVKANFQRLIKSAKLKALKNEQHRRVKANFQRLIKSAKLKALKNEQHRRVKANFQRIIKSAKEKGIWKIGWSTIRIDDLAYIVNRGNRVAHLLNYIIQHIFLTEPRQKAPSIFVVALSLLKHLETKKKKSAKAVLETEEAYQRALEGQLKTKGKVEKLILEEKECTSNIKKADIDIRANEKRLAEIQEKVKGNEIMLDKEKLKKSETNSNSEKVRVGSVIAGVASTGLVISAVVVTVAFPPAIGLWAAGLAWGGAATATGVGAMKLKSSAAAADDLAEKMVADQESNLSESESLLRTIKKEKAILKNKVESVQSDIEVLNANLSVEESKNQELKNQIQSLSVLNEFLKNLHTLISRLVMKSEVLSGSVVHNEKMKNYGSSNDLFGITSEILNLMINANENCLDYIDIRMDELNNVASIKSDLLADEQAKNTVRRQTPNQLNLDDY